MKPSCRRTGRFLPAVVLVFAGHAFAEDSTPTAAAVAENPALGLTVDLGWASAYNWRGLNLYKETNQLDQNGYLSPSITYQVADAFSIGYWGAFQLNGNNTAQMIDAAYSGEQDLLANYSVGIAEGTSLNLGLVAYLYPLADEEEAGVATPTYLEPAIGVSWAGPIDLGMKVSYFHGVQDELSAYRYLYLSPTVGKSFELTRHVGLGLALGLGYKQFTEVAATENTLDLSMTAALPIAFDNGFYVKPAIGGAWTNLEKNGDGEEAGFAEEAFVFGALNVGLKL